MDKLNAETNVSLYTQLANQIRSDIYERKFTAGEKIPSEFELSDMYQVSRSTVRKAISVLVDENLLVKAHGKGTFVATESIQQNNPAFLSFTDNAKSMGQTLITKTVGMKHTEPTPSQKNFFNLKDGDTLLEIERVRSIDNLPICVETTWFTTDFDFLESANLDGSLYAILQNDYNIYPLGGSKTIELCYASVEEAQLLDIPRGFALMLVEDHVYDSRNLPLHITKQVVRGDKFKYALK